MNCVVEVRSAETVFLDLLFRKRFLRKTDVIYSLQAVFITQGLIERKLN